MKNKTTETRKPKRKYFRKCGFCGERHEQSYMVRTVDSPNGWMCHRCHEEMHPYDNYYDDIIMAEDNDIL